MKNIWKKMKDLYNNADEDNQVLIECCVIPFVVGALILICIKIF
jgi:hypothetical protein